MKLYRHYKNKFYRVLGEGRHSENEEPFVIYETRYENEISRTWLRPKSMFFASVVIGDQSVPRFAQVALVVEQVSEISVAHLQIVSSLLNEVIDRDALQARCKAQSKIHLLMAHIEGQPVAFKLGYELSAGVFYSWLGGVAPRFRRLGIASDLLQTQHRWCHEQGYEKIQTKTLTNPMLILNLQNGFEVINTESSKRGLKTVLEKRLRQ